MTPGPPAAGGPPSIPPRLAVLLSGGGRTLLNLLDHTDAGTLRASIALVVASRESPGADHARRRGVPTRVLPGRIPVRDLEGLLHEHAVDYAVLAGYLHLLPIPAAYRDRVTNIHPSLLPRFGGPGMHGRHVHEAVLASGDPISGCTVHLCTDEYDRGPILLQRTCPVLSADTPDTLAARVFALECEAYPAALTLLFDRGVPQ